MKQIHDLKVEIFADGAYKAREAIMPFALTRNFSIFDWALAIGAMFQLWSAKCSVRGFGPNISRCFQAGSVPTIR
jgi:hypothetical protein